MVPSCFAGCMGAAALMVVNLENLKLTNFIAFKHFRIIWCSRNSIFRSEKFLFKYVTIVWHSKMLGHNYFLSFFHFMSIFPLLETVWRFQYLLLEKRTVFKHDAQNNESGNESDSFSFGISKNMLNFSIQNLMKSWRYPGEKSHYFPNEIY